MNTPDIALRNFRDSVNRRMADAGLTVYDRIDPLVGASSIGLFKKAYPMETLCDPNYKFACPLPHETSQVTGADVVVVSFDDGPHYVENMEAYTLSLRYFNSGSSKVIENV